MMTPWSFWTRHSAAELSGASGCALRAWRVAAIICVALLSCGSALLSLGEPAFDRALERLPVGALKRLGTSDLFAGWATEAPTKKPRGVNLLVRWGRSLLWSASLDGSIALWDPLSGERRRHVRIAPGRNHVSSICRRGDLMAFSTMESSTQESIVLFDLRKGAIRKKLGRYTCAVTCLAFSPGCALLAAGFGNHPDGPRSKDNQIRVWDVCTGQELRGCPIRGHITPRVGPSDESWQHE
jgi:hypothetical protein